MAGASAGAGAAAAAVAQAIKASGVFVSVEPSDFAAILAQSEAPLVVIAKGGLFQPDLQYLTSYKGLAFYAQSNTEIPLPADAQVIRARKMWIPG
jgi:hypothetical protein